MRERGRERGWCDIRSFSFLPLENCCAQTSRTCIHVRIVVKYNKLSFKSYLKDSRRIRGWKHKIIFLEKSIWKRVEFYRIVSIIVIERTGERKLLTIGLILLELKKKKRKKNNPLDLKSMKKKFKEKEKKKFPFSSMKRALSNASKKRKRKISRKLLDNPPNIIPSYWG